MFGLFLRSLAFLTLTMVLASCAPRPRSLDLPQIFEIRAVAVTANAGIPRAMMRTIYQQMDKAVKATAHTEPLPRAVMNVHIVAVSRDLTYDGYRTQTEVSVALTDITSGYPVQVRSFLVYSFSLDRRYADNAASDAIAARLRAEYALMEPAIREPRVIPVISTRMKSDTPGLDAVDTRPIVVPLKTAPDVGADQDPLLNSKTSVDPIAEPKKAVVMPDAKPVKSETTPAENALEAGAKAKVVIQPKAVDPAPADAEPCVETLDKKC